MTRPRPVLTFFSDEGIERNENEEIARREIPACTAGVRFEGGDYQEVVTVLERLDRALSRQDIAVSLIPPPGIVRTFYGYERDIWER